MSIFANNSSIKVYNEGWTVVGNPVEFDQEDLNMLKPTAEIVKSIYGASVKFYLRDGNGTVYIPLSSKEDILIGTVVEVTSLAVITLQKPGHDDIQRIVLKDSAKPQLEEEVTNELPDDFEL